jgi:cell division protein FtsL
MNLRRIKSLWQAGAAIAGSLVGLVLYVRLFAEPWTIGNQVSQEVRLLDTQLQERRKDNARLQEQLTYLLSPSGVEALARSRGYHRPGEQVYLYSKISTSNP